MNGHGEQGNVILKKINVLKESHYTDCKVCN